MSEIWTTTSCFLYRGNTHHVAAGDELTLTLADPASLVIRKAGGREKVLDVALGPEEPQRPDRRFARGSGRDHEPSDDFQGSVSVLRDQHGCDVLQIVLGFKGPDTGDDDDTEVVVATKPATQ